MILQFARRAGASRDKCFHQTNAQTVPRFGGIAIGAGFVAVLLTAIYANEATVPRDLLAVVLGSLAMFGLGVLDDLRPIGAKFKLIGQIAIAYIVAHGGPSVETVTNPLTGSGYDISAFGVAATVLWLVALTNLINIIDGIDGLAGGISLMLMVLLVHSSLHGDSVLPHIATGRVKPIALSGARRHPLLPNVATFMELGYADYQISVWFGMFAPAATPPDIVRRLSGVIWEAVSSRDFIDNMLLKNSPLVSVHHLTTVISI